MTAATAAAQPRAAPDPRYVVGGLVLLASAGGLLASAQTASEPTVSVVYGSLALAVYAWGLLCLVGSRYGAGLGLTLWKLGPWTLLWYGGAFGLATVTWSQAQSGTAAEISIGSVQQALWLVAVGITALTAGYCVGPGQLARLAVTRIVIGVECRFAATVRNALAPWLLYATGIGARLATTATTGLFGYVGDPSSAVTTASGYQQVLSLLSLCAPLAVSVAALRVYREHAPRARMTLYALFGMELLFGAAAGGKQSFVVAVLAVLIPRSAARRRLPKAAVLAAVAVFMVIVIPFNQAYRGTVRTASATLSPRDAVAAAPGIVAKTLTSRNPLAGMPGSLGYLLQRIREIDGPAIIMERTPTQIGFVNGTQLAFGPLAGFVPRAVWPDKPILDDGYQFGQQYYGLPPGVYTSFAVTPVGDLFRHGGWIPVIAGLGLLGCGIRLLDDVLDVRADPRGLLLLLLLFPLIVKSEQDWTELIASLPATVLLWLVTVAVAFRRRRAE